MLIDERRKNERDDKDRKLPHGEGKSVERRNAKSEKAQTQQQIPKNFGRQVIFGEVEYFHFAIILCDLYKL